MMDSANTLRLLAIIVPICVGVLGVMGIGWLSWFVKSMGDKNFYPMASGTKLENELRELRKDMWEAIDQMRKDTQYTREWMARHEGMGKRSGAG